MTEKCRDTKRTGIYRLSGKITDLRLDIKLRHLSEWLPVPKLDYAGAGIYQHAQRQHRSNRTEFL
ncbi:GL25363 [Drosophila persimilis]|uniref:GL25363 n=1 Tax=Drosophila persimilis TaxID=7234 RepID=B4GU35_DROPE|nr:GL25363 [Drosophila persimilis]